MCIATTGQHDLIAARATAWRMLAVVSLAQFLA
jgi:hypothetical protein